MTKRVREVVVGDSIELDCGYGPHEHMEFCKVLSVEEGVGLFGDREIRMSVRYQDQSVGSTSFSIDKYPYQTVNVIEAPPKKVYKKRNIPRPVDIPEDLTALDMYIGWRRYEKLRKFHVADFSELWRRNIHENYRFDELVDAWPGYPEKRKFET